MLLYDLVKTVKIQIIKEFLKQKILKGILYTEQYIRLKEKAEDGFYTHK